MAQSKPPVRGNGAPLTRSYAVTVDLAPGSSDDESEPHGFTSDHSEVSAGSPAERSRRFPTDPSSAYNAGYTTEQPLHARQYAIRQPMDRNRGPRSFVPSEMPVEMRSSELHSDVESSFEGRWLRLCTQPGKSAAIQVSNVKSLRNAHLLRILIPKATAMGELASSLQKQASNHGSAAMFPSPDRGNSGGHTGGAGDGSMGPSRCTWISDGNANQLLHLFNEHFEEKAMEAATLKNPRVAEAMSAHDINEMLHNMKKKSGPPGGYVSAVDELPLGDAHTTQPVMIGANGNALVVLCGEVEADFSQVVSYARCGGRGSDYFAACFGLPEMYVSQPSAVPRHSMAGADKVVVHAILEATILTVSRGPRQKDGSLPSYKKKVEAVAGIKRRRKSMHKAAIWASAEGEEDDNEDDVDDILPDAAMFASAMHGLPATTRFESTMNPAAGAGTLAGMPAWSGPMQHPESISRGGSNSTAWSWDSHSMVVPYGPPESEPATFLSGWRGAEGHPSSPHAIHNNVQQQQQQHVMAMSHADQAATKIQRGEPCWIFVDPRAGGQAPSQITINIPAVWVKWVSS